MCGGASLSKRLGLGIIKDTITNPGAFLKDPLKGVKDSFANAKEVAKADALHYGILKTPPAVVDPAIERNAQLAASTTSANLRLAMQRKAMRDNSLLTGGGLAPNGTGGNTTLGV